MVPWKVDDFDFFSSRLEQNITDTLAARIDPDRPSPLQQDHPGFGTATSIVESLKQEALGLREYFSLPVLVEGNGGPIRLTACPNLEADMNLMSLALATKLGITIEHVKANPDKETMFELAHHKVVKGVGSAIIGCSVADMLSDNSASSTPQYLFYVLESLPLALDIVVGSAFLEETGLYVTYQGRFGGKVHPTAVPITDDSDPDKYDTNPYSSESESETSAEAPSSPASDGLQIVQTNFYLTQRAIMGVFSELFKRHEVWLIYVKYDPTWKPEDGGRPRNIRTAKSAILVDASIERMMTRFKIWRQGSKGDNASLLSQQSREVKGSLALDEQRENARLEILRRKGM